MPCCPPLKSVVLVVDKFSQDVHLAYRTAGVKYPVDYDPVTKQIEYTSGFFSILADLANIQSGTRIFFYRRRIDEPPQSRGFIGEWVATMKPYEDRNTSLSFQSLQILGSCPNCGSPNSTLREGEPVCSSCSTPLRGHILPLRFSFTSLQQYPQYLDDNTAYIDITDAGRLSTLIFRKITGAGRERSINPILPEEAEKLRRLLARVSAQQKNTLVYFPASQPSPKPGTPISNFLNFQLKYPLRNRGTTFLYDLKSGTLFYETILEFWLVEALSSMSPQIADLLALFPNEQVEWFSNQILFGIGGEKSDVLLLMRDQESGLRCRAVVIELKRDAIDSDTLTQVKAYSYWIAQLATAQVQARSPFIISPLAIGRRVARNTQPFAPFTFAIPYTQPLQVLVEAPRVYTYTVDPVANTLVLSRQI